jgi:hypothetical protein
MSERRIIIVIVIALFAGAWFFGYDNGGGPGGGGGGANPSGGGSPSTAAPLIDVGSPSLPHGAIAPAPGAAANPVARTPADAGSADSTAHGGFAEGRRPSGTWLLVPDAALNATTTIATSTTTTNTTAAPASINPTTAPTSDLPRITFRPDGTFTEHLLLSTDGLPLRPGLRRPDLTGRYALHGYTLAVVRDDDEYTALDPRAPRNFDYTISPLFGENDKGMPVRLYIDGHVLEYQK